MYSSGNPTNIANPINDASVQIDIKTVSGKLTLYQTTLCEKLPWEKLNSYYNLDPRHYLDTYNKNDIQLICCQADASVLWLVPDVVESRFTQSLNRETDMDITFTWVLTRDRPTGKEVVKYVRTVDRVDLPERSDVQKVLNGSTDSFRVYNLYPKYFRVTGSGEVRPFEQEVCLSPCLNTYCILAIKLKSFQFPKKIRKGIINITHLCKYKIYLPLSFELVFVSNIHYRIWRMLF